MRGRVRRDTVGRKAVKVVERIAFCTDARGECCVGGKGSRGKKTQDRN